MNKIWQLQEAKNKLSEVVEEALVHGPQTITRRGRETVVVVAWEEFRKMRRSQTRLSRFFAESPLSDLDLEKERPKDLPREVNL
jgi:prevent-host-death family protein